MAASPIGMAAGLAGGIIGAINSGPSSAMTALNNQVQDFSKYMTAQAKSEGIDASTTFQQIMQPLQRIVSGGLIKRDGVRHKLTPLTPSKRKLPHLLRVTFGCNCPGARTVWSDYIFG